MCIHYFVFPLYICLWCLSDLRTRWGQPGGDVHLQFFDQEPVCCHTSQSGPQSWEEVLQEVLLVDLAHLIPWHFLHQHQACGDGVGRHLLPAINPDVNALKTVYCREEDKHRLNSDWHAQGHTHTHWSMCTHGWEYARAHICNNKKENKSRKQLQNKG